MLPAFWVHPEPLSIPECSATFGWSLKTKRSAGLQERRGGSRLDRGASTRTGEPRSEKRWQAETTSAGDSHGKEGESTERGFTNTQAGLKPQRFWFREPAEEWTSAIPLGNGRIGAMIFGGVDDEEILVNESTIWCGPPTPTDNPGAPELISQMRELLFAGKNAEAESICRNQFLEPDSDGERRSFQPLGFIHLEHRGLGETEDYRRELSFNTATARTTFRSQGTSYKREAFVSEPDQVLVCEYTADKAGAVSFEVTLTRPSGATVTATSDRLRLTGRAAAENGEFPGTSFQMTVTARTEGGGGGGPTTSFWRRECNTPGQRGNGL